MLKKLNLNKFGEQNEGLAVLIFLHIFIVSALPIATMAFTCQQCGEKSNVILPKFTQQGNRHKRECQTFCTIECCEAYISEENGNGPLCRVCKAPHCTQRCGGCHYVFYCGGDCQISDWKAHKILCKRISTLREIPPRPTEACEIDGVVFTDACFKK